MSAEKPQSREQAKHETREALMLAGIAEFAEKGFDVPSLDAICARAGRTRGAFYVHFRDRDDFVVAAMERVLGTFLDVVIGTGEPGEGLEEAIQRFVWILASSREIIASGADPTSVPSWEVLSLHRVLEASARSDAVRQQFATMLAGAIERLGERITDDQRTSLLRSDVDAQQVATLLVALALGASVALETGIDFDPRKAGATLLKMLAETSAPTGAARR